MPRIIFLRHGESESNATDATGEFSTPLTKLGIKQAQVAGKFLAENYNITKIIHSPMIRALETARYVSKELEIKHIESMDAISEGDNGKLVGMRRDEVVNVPKIGKRADVLLKKIGAFSFIDQTKNASKFVELSNKLMSLVDGETDAQLYTRVRSAIKNIKQIKTTGDILVVSHNGFIKAALFVMFKISDKGNGNLFDKYKNCHVSVINKDTGILELQMFSKYLDDI